MFSPHISARKKVTHARKKKIPLPYHFTDTSAGARLLSLPAVVLMPLKKALSAGGGGPRVDSAGSDFVPRVPVFGEDDPAGEKLDSMSEIMIEIMI